MTVIAMTREIGSLGNDVAEALAAKLGLQIVRSEAVAEIVAERLGVDAAAVLRYVEGTASLAERWRIDRRRLFHYVAEEILRIAQQGNVLLKGWGAATLLRDMPQVICVRVVASNEFRVRVLMKRFGTADADAVRAQIERQDAARARTMRALFGAENEDEGLYQVVLNTERLSIEDCVKAVADLAQTRRLRDGAAVRTALADKLMAAKIGAAFAEQISLGMAPLGVAVSVAAGRITLAGTSSNGGLRRRAERIVRDFAQGYEIDNRIVSVPAYGRRGPTVSASFLTESR